MPESRPPRRARAEAPPAPGLANFLDKSPGLTAHCPSCYRQVGLTFRALVDLAGPEETIEGLKRRLRCVECGTRGAGMPSRGAGQGGGCQPRQGPPQRPRRSCGEAGGGSPAAKPSCC